MLTSNLNFIAILLAAIAAWLAGAVWYGVLSKQWLAALGKTRAELPMSVAPMILSFVGDLILSFVLAIVIGIFTNHAATIEAALSCAGLMWVGFVLSTITVNNAFGGRKPMLTLIDAGHWLLAMFASAAVIGAFGS